MDLKIDPTDVSTMAQRAQQIAVAQESKPQAVGAVGTFMAGAINVMAALVGKRQPDGDMATCINPVSVMYAGILLAKMAESAAPVPGSQALLAIDVDVGHGSFKSALDTLEKIYPNVDEYLDEEMLSGIRQYEAFKTEGIQALPEPLQKLVRDVQRQLH